MRKLKLYTSNPDVLWLKGRRDYPKDAYAKAKVRRILIGATLLHFFRRASPLLDNHDKA